MNVLNMSQDLEMVKHSFCLRYNVTGYNNPIIMMTWRFKGTFRESLELEHFPLDVQVSSVFSSMICVVNNPTDLPLKGSALKVQSRFYYLYFPHC